MCQLLPYMIYNSPKFVSLLFNSCLKPIIISVLHLNFKSWVHDAPELYQLRNSAVWIYFCPVCKKDSWACSLSLSLQTPKLRKTLAFACFISTLVGFQNFCLEIMSSKSFQYFCSIWGSGKFKKCLLLKNTSIIEVRYEI